MGTEYRKPILAGEKSRNAITLHNICQLKSVMSIKVAGFDNSNESQIIEPPLTTASIHGTEMGYIATDILMKRIAYPDTPYTSTYVQTDIIYRHSTGNES